MKRKTIYKKMNIWPGKGFGRFKLSAAELAMGRVMRAPDGHEGGEGDAGNGDGAGGGDTGAAGGDGAGEAGAAGGGAGDGGAADAGAGGGADGGAGDGGAGDGSILGDAGRAVTVPKTAMRKMVKAARLEKATRRD